MQSLTRRQFAAAASLAPFCLPGCGPLPTPAEPPTEVFYGDAFDAFTNRLYQVLPDRDKNGFLSPYSIGVALSMTAEGARGTTLAQMEKTLGVTSAELAAKTSKKTALKDPGYELAVANSLWPQKGDPWSEAFLAKVVNTYSAVVKECDYQTDPDACRQTINRWVEEKTREKIKDLLPSGCINALTRLVLVNAIYFKGRWKTQFKKEQTRDADFTRLDGSKKKVPLMHRNVTTQYFQNDAVLAVRLPYQGDALSMLVVLPKDAAKFRELDAKLDLAKMNEWAKASHEIKECNVWLPRFKIETTYRLNDPLKVLGMFDAFNESVADFSGMSRDSRKDLFISLVIHKAFVDVNEEGTEAAAATGVVMQTKSAIRHESFRADRPFWFAIRHDATDSILFLGRCLDP